MPKVPKMQNQRKRQKKPGAKHQKIIKVIGEKGTQVYKGKDRRTHREQVFFDSAQTSRRFAINPNNIGKKRLKVLNAVGPPKRLLGRNTFPSTRNAKHREKRI